MTPAQGSSGDERGVQSQHELRMRAVLERRSKHNEDMRAAKGKGTVRATTPPPKPRKVLYVTSDSSSEEDRPPTRTPAVHPNDPVDRLFFPTRQNVVHALKISSSRMFIFINAGIPV